MTAIKRMKVIAKVGPDRFVKYNVDNLLSFTKFLDRSYPDWKWFNVFDKRSREQVSSYTKNHRPHTKHE